MKIPEARNLVNERIRNLAAYHLAPIEVGVKLNQNENPFDWPLSVKQEVARFVVERPWNRYPEFIPQQLRDALAKHVGVRSENILVGNGSNEMLLVLMLSFGGVGRRVILSEPTFTVYRLLAQGTGAEPIVVPLTRTLTYDIEGLCDAARKNPGAIMIVTSPNNPTGNAVSESELLRLLDAHTGALVFDQAYAEFGGFNAIPLLDRFPNLIVTRTFSKAMAGAGLRLGYIAAHAEVVVELNKIKLPYNINFFSDHVAQVLLRHREIVDAQVQQLIAERERVCAFFATQPIADIYPSLANFFCIRTDRKAALFEFLKKRDILVRDVSSYPMLENCLRISIGSPAENDALCAATRDFFSSKG